MADTIDTSQFSEEVASLIKSQLRQGFRVLLDCKRTSGEWRAEIWHYSSVWSQRSRATNKSLLTALFDAITESDKKWYRR